MGEQGRRINVVGAMLCGKALATSILGIQKCCVARERAMSVQGRCMGCGDLASARRMVRVGHRNNPVGWAVSSYRSRSHGGVSGREAGVHFGMGKCRTGGLVVLYRGISVVLEHGELS